MWLRSSPLLVLAVTLTSTFVTSSPISHQQQDSNPTPQQQFRGIFIARDSVVDWAGAAGSGNISWSLVEATRGLDANPDFVKWWTLASSSAGFLRGAYHIAVPSNDTNSAAMQAQAFVQHSTISNGTNGTNSSVLRRAPGDGTEFPMTLRIGLDSSVETVKCFGLNPTEMTAWIASFIAEYTSLTAQKHIAINMNAQWWGACTGDATDFSHDHLLFYRSFGQEPHGGLGGWMQVPAIGSGQVQSGGDLYLWDQGFNVDIHAWGKGEIQAPEGGEF